MCKVCHTVAVGNLDTAEQNAYGVQPHAVFKYNAAAAATLLRCCVIQNADYTPELTGMLSQQATWQMLQLKPQLDKLLAGATNGSTASGTATAQIG
jgi:hypothetical protein